MLFNSYIFIFLFLPILLIGWFNLNKLPNGIYAKVFLLIMSLWFYGYFNLNYLAILLSSLVVNYAFSYLLEKRKGSKTVMLLGVIFNLAVLGYFKYYDFFISNINMAFKASFGLKHILLPLGISFFTFQQISYVIDRYRGDAPHYSFIDYATFVAYFPQLIAGPIVLHNELVPQFNDATKKRFCIKDFEYGCIFFIVGLAKKVLLADLLAGVANYGFDSIAYLDTPSAILVIVSYSLELLFDFSGYCDMAIGVAKMMRIDLPDNFDAPYTSTSIEMLWRKWHITLGRFFRIYVYFPLGGSRKGFARKLVNCMIVFLLSGLWHGANWTFVIWGLMQGVAICFAYIARRLDKRADNKDNTVVVVIKRIITMSYFLLSLIVFRSNSLSDARLFFERLFSGESYHNASYIANQINFEELYIVLKWVEMNYPGQIYLVKLVILLIVIGIAIVLSQLKPLRKRLENNRHKAFHAVALGFICVWAVISLSGVSTFLYFNF